MREIYKDPLLYYVLIPLLVGIWPLLIWAMYLPGAKQARDREAGLCVQGQVDVNDILKIDPERPDVTKTTPAQAEFTYVAAAGRVANLCKIPSSNWKADSGGISTANGKKRQDGSVNLSAVSIKQAASFLWRIQSMYPMRLTCESVKLQAKKGMKDQWDAVFNFHYYY